MQLFWKTEAATPRSTEAPSVVGLHLDGMCTLSATGRKRQRPQLMRTAVTERIHSAESRRISFQMVHLADACHVGIHQTVLPAGQPFTAVKPTAHPRTVTTSVDRQQQLPWRHPFQVAQIGVKRVNARHTNSHLAALVHADGLAAQLIATPVKIYHEVVARRSLLLQGSRHTVTLPAAYSTRYSSVGSSEAGIVTTTLRPKRMARTPSSPSAPVPSRPA